MAIYSCNLTSIGRSTHEAGTAGAHISYIARSSAAPEILCQDMPDHPRAARAFLDAGEKADRKNARVVDKIRVALPRELSAEQRAALVREFMGDLTGGKVAWFAAIHQTGKDAHNPHAHIVVRDRDLQTGKRVLCLAENYKDRAKKGLPGPKAVEYVRERWEHHINLSLERAGHTIRVDRRTLEAQGIDRVPQIHVGPSAKLVFEQVARPKSQVRVNGAGRTVNYPAIDEGKTRREHNNEILDLNLEKGIRSKNFETREWAKLEKLERHRDRKLEDKLIAAARERTREERAVKRKYAEKAEANRAKQKAQYDLVNNWMHQQYNHEKTALQTSHRAEMRQLEKDQGRFFNRLLTFWDFSGERRRKQEVTKTSLKSTHRAEAKALRLQMQQKAENRLEASQGRLRAEMKFLKTSRSQELEGFKAQAREADRQADTLWQAREAEREREREVLTKALSNWKRDQKDRQKIIEQDNSRSRAMERFEEMQARSRDQDRGLERTLER